MSESQNINNRTGLEIAVIGLAGRFPGAGNIDQFWENLKNGVESISFFSGKELEEYGIEHHVVENANYVKAKGVLDDIECFDAYFFGYTPREAENMEPQLRLFHECAYHALENAGYEPDSYDGLIGVYAGASLDFFWMVRLMLDAIAAGEDIQLEEMLNKDYGFSSRLAYKLNLKGPSLTMQTACSTSLVAIHLACQGLLSAECDIALAGGVRVSIPQKAGYMYREGMILAPDGHCRAFDGSANGTLFGDGVGFVVLKRLENALEEGDFIHAVIKGSAINNDGKRRVGYTAPSIEGQADVIKTAYTMAEVEPESISYIETHGTGTKLGDPVEIEGLKLAFNTNKKAFCRIGSVKTNIGHLGCAAGVAGFIKTVLALKHRFIPPSLHFETANPQIDFQESPFYVNSALTEWKRSKYPLRAGVSSFGMGGANAHVVLEEPPQRTITTRPSREPQLLLLSAKTKTALASACENLVNYFKENPGTDFADAAYTLKVGRKSFEHRRMLVCRDLKLAIEGLASADTGNLYANVSSEENRMVVFMFPGQGSQYVNMGLELYGTEPVFREQIDRCFEILKSLMSYDVKKILYPVRATGTSGYREPTMEKKGIHHSDSIDINQTEITQPAIFIFEYALAMLLMKWGIKPRAMIGHSIGEYVAACISGVLSLKDALKIVALRGRLMQQTRRGAMLSIPLPEEELTPLLNNDLSLAAVNSSSLCVVSGSHDAIDGFEKILEEKRYEYNRLHTSHAFHSEMMAPVPGRFLEDLRKIKLNKPQIPFLSNVTGTWMTLEQAADPQYWANQLRVMVRFSDGLSELLKENNGIFLEVGPGNALSTFVRKHRDKKPHHSILNLVRHPRENIPDVDFLLEKIGHLWLLGKDIDWFEFYAREKRHRLPLPMYPFKPERYRVDPSFFSRLSQISQMFQTSQMSITSSTPGRKKDLADWFYIPAWECSDLPIVRPVENPPIMCWLVFSCGSNLGNLLLDQIKHKNQRVIIVSPGTAFAKQGNNGVRYTINPQREGDYNALVEELFASNMVPHRILHLWNVTGLEGERHWLNETSKAKLEKIDKNLDYGFYSLLNLARALGSQNIKEKIQMTILTDKTLTVTGEEILEVSKSTILGAVQVIPREYGAIKCRLIDIATPEPGGWGEKRLVENLLMEIEAGMSDTIVAYRGYHRWIRTIRATRLEDTGKQAPELKTEGVYLVTGGLGGIGLVLAEYLAKTLRARLILTGRSTFPTREEWQDWLMNHDTDDHIGKKIQKLQEMEKAGAEISIFSADVTNLEQMHRVVTRAEEKFGKIHGVIHSAGLPDGALIRRRTREMSEKVLAPKIKGTLVLDTLFKGREPEFFILCSSLSSITAPIGQVAYCAANAFLDAFAHSKALNSTLTISINWDAWQEVGMAAEAVGISNAPQDRLITQDINPRHPLFDKREIYDSHREAFISNLSVTKCWVLDEHRIMGKATLPGTTYLEMARAAFENQTKSTTVELRDVYFLAPLSVKEDEEKKVRTILTKQEHGYAFSIVSCPNPEEDRWVEHARGEAVSPVEIEPVQYEIKEIEEKCTVSEIDYQLEEFPVGSGVITFGPRWNNLRQAKFGINRGLGILELPEAFVADMNSFKLHPALLDVGNSLLKRIRKEKEAHFPFFYKKIKVIGSMEGRVLFYVRSAENSKSDSLNETLTYDITIMNERGVTLVDIEGYTSKKVNFDTHTAKEFLGRNFNRHSHATTVPPVYSKWGIEIENRLEPGEKARETLSKRGILPAEGVEVFKRALKGNRYPQVIVCTTDFFTHLKQYRALTDELQLKEEFTGVSSYLPQHSRPELGTEFVEPGTGSEKILARLWQTLLGIEQIGIHDNFFELGGDSLNAVTFAGRIKKEFNMDIPLTEFFNRPTIKELAQYIEHNVKEAIPSSINATEKKEYYSVSPAQKRFFILHEMDWKSAGYHNVNHYLMDKNIKIDKLEEAFRTLIKRHEILRTSFKIVGEGAAQIIHDSVDFSIEYYEANSLHSSPSPSDLISNFIRPFDLEKAPLMRVGIIKTPNNENLLLIDIYHILTDLSSQGILKKELVSLYSGETLLPLRIQYKDYAEWCNSRQQQDFISRQKDYWLRVFSDIPRPLEIPIDFPRPRIRSFEGSSIRFEMKKDCIHRLKAMAAAEGVTLFMAFLAILNVFLAKICSEDDIVVGTPVQGRMHADLEKIIGPFINTLALRNAPAGEKTFAGFLREVKENTINAFDNSDLQFEILVDTLALTRNPAHNPLFDVAFSLIAGELKSQNSPEIDLKPYETGTGNKIVYFDLVVYHQLVADSAWLNIEYSTRLFKRSTIDEMLIIYNAILEQVTMFSHMKLKDIVIPHVFLTASSTFPDENEEDFGF